MFTIAAIMATAVSTLSTLGYFGIVEIDTAVELPLGQGNLEVKFTQEQPLHLSIKRG